MPDQQPELLSLTEQTDQLIAALAGNAERLHVEAVQAHEKAIEERDQLYQDWENLLYDALERRRLQWAKDFRHQWILAAAKRLACLSLPPSEIMALLEIDR